VRLTPIYELLKGLISSRCEISNTFPSCWDSQLVYIFQGGSILVGDLISLNN